MKTLKKSAAKQAQATQKPYVAQCESCHANLTTIHLVNGEEESWLCDPCAKETVWDMVIGNTLTSFQSPIKNESHNCTEVFCL